jgi:hypothetical protein
VVAIALGLTWLTVAACATDTSPAADRDGAPSPRTDGSPFEPPSDGGVPATDGGRAMRPDAGPDWVPPECAGDSSPTSFCEGATWGGTAPASSTDLVVGAGMHVVLDCDGAARTLTIEEGGCVTASRAESSTLTLHGNLIVRGQLDLGRPSDRIPDGVRAEIVFTGMRDDQYAGQAMRTVGSERGPSIDEPVEILATDVGLWVVGQGIFTAAGVEKRAWSFLTDGAGPGDPQLEVEDAASWQVGDRIVLTPTAMRVETDHASQFDERAIAEIAGGTVTLESAPEFLHAGCTDCMRRGEAANLSRNVVIRSADDEGHAHMLIAEEGVLQLDSVELRWLGPEQCGGPARRRPVTFYQQHDAADRSFVRHSAIWGGQQGFIGVEKSNGVQIADVVGYDGFGTGFSLFYDNSACGTRCTDRESAPSDIVMTDVLAAKVGVATRESGCLRISHRMTAFVVSGGERSGCIGCVATGVAHVGSGADISAFSWAEGGSGRPMEFTFTENIAHNNRSHGAHVWHNVTQPQEPYRNNRFWSNDDHGILWGAYGTLLRLEDFTSVDNGNPSIGVKAVPQNDEVRLGAATIDQVRVLAYVNVQSVPNVLADLRFTGEREVGFTQIHDECTDGDENDPEDGDCTRIWLRIVNPMFAAGMNPFDFGWTQNRHAIWEVRGFSHPDAVYGDLPADFDLHRRDNTVEGGHYDDRFDAWLVPR